MQMNNDSAHAQRKQFTPKTIDVNLEQVAWVGGRSRKRQPHGKSLMLFAETRVHGLQICRKYAKEILTPRKKHEGKFVKWQVNGVMLTVKG
jgi:hypothetical protein